MVNLFAFQPSWYPRNGNDGRHPQKTIVFTPKIRRIRMATKVPHKKSGKTYLFLRTGYGAFRAMAMASTLHALNPEIDEGEIGMIAACDSHGKVHWIDHRLVEVIELDGLEPRELLDDL